MPTLNFKVGRPTPWVTKIKLSVSDLLRSLWDKVPLYPPLWREEKLPYGTLELYLEIPLRWVFLIWRSKRRLKGPVNWEKSAEPDPPRGSENVDSKHDTFR